jgi:hypothetical protein
LFLGVAAVDNRIAAGPADQAGENGWVKWHE